MILAVDIGTGSCKAVLVGPNGEVLARRAVGYALRSTEPGEAEQDAAEVLRAVDLATGAAVADAPGRLRAVVLSSAMHTVIALDRNGEPATPVLTWADRRGAEDAAALAGTDLGRELWARTGTPIHASSPMCKLGWLRRERAELFARASAFVSIKELVIRRWLGSEIVDASTASATGLYDLECGEWYALALRQCGVDPARLGRVVPTTEVSTSWRAGARAALGLDDQTPLVVGATDGVLANVGVGAVRPGVVAVTLGTSAAARTVVTAAAGDPDRGLFCYVLDDGRFVAGGAVNNAGLALERAADLLEVDGVSAVLAMAERSPPGARGLVCLPRVAGERFPDYDSGRRGAFAGWSVEHSRDDFARAVLEGVLRAVAGVAAAVGAVHGDLVEVRGGGGLLRSPLVRRILADSIGRPLRIPASVEATAVGAVWLARHALGDPDVWQRCAELDGAEVVTPSRDGERLYRELSERAVEQLGG